MTEPVGPSMIVVDDHKPVTTERSFQDVSTGITVVSPSVIAFGEQLPDVTFEKVAAVPAKPEKRRRALTPTVMRGGLVGDAFPSPARPSAPSQPESEIARAPETTNTPPETNVPQEAAASDEPPEPVLR